GVPLSVPEIRRLFWRLVLALAPRVERILAWSRWRRVHQGIAKYWHYKRRVISEVDPNPTLLSPAAKSPCVAVTSISAKEGSQFHAAVIAMKSMCVISTELRHIG